MAETYRAGVLRGPKDLAILDIPVWNLEDYGDDDLMLIEVGACGVCGSDFRYFLGENPWAQHTLGRFMPNPPNIVLGHEYAGTVVRVRSKENEAWLGKRVAPICSKVCGICPDCREGREHLCANTVHMGHGQGWGDRAFYPGAYGRYTLAWGRECFEIPAHVSDAEAAMMDILAVCAHVARMGNVTPGRPVLCIGAGPAGNGIAQAALAMGASEAVLIDPLESARDIARQQGIGQALAPEEFVPDRQFGSVFDTVGTAQTFDLALRVLGKGGTLACIAVHDEAFPLNVMLLGAERRITTSCNFERRDFEQALAWLASGQMAVKDWLTPISLDDLPARFAEATSPGGKTAFKLLVDPKL